jgi:SAM-dependent methyltransferase
MKSNRATNPSAFLYEDARFRVVGEPRIELPESARRALEEAHQGLAAHPDARLVGCLCGSGADVRVTLGDRHGLPFCLLLCRRCGLIRANPQPSAEQLVWFYSQVYRRLYGPFARTDDTLFESKLWKGELVRQALAAARISLASGPIVDLGCGGGWTLAPLGSLQQPLIGFDFDEGLLALGKSRGLDLRLGGLPRALADGVRAALVIFGHVLEHTLDPEAELRALAALLAPGGLLYLEVPHTRRIGGAALQNDSLRYWQRAHLWDFQREHLRALAERAGYDVLWESEDEASVFLLCRPGREAAPAEFPALGSRVEAQLRRFEARYQSRSHRLLTAARRAYGRGARLLRAAR